MEGRGFEYPTDSVSAPNGRLYVTNKSRNYGERGVRITVLDLDLFVTYKRPFGADTESVGYSNPLPSIATIPRVSKYSIIFQLR
jgi:hypothetical protein